MPVIEATETCPRVVVCDRTISVYVHSDASMTVPKHEWLWSLRYQDEPECQSSSYRMLAASMGESYRYLIMECTKEEAWVRIQKMRAAIKRHDANPET